MSAFTSLIVRTPRWVPPTVTGLILAFAIPLVVLSRLNAERSRLTSLSTERKATADELALIQKRVSVLESELLNAKQDILTLRHRRIPSEQVSLSLVAIGVEWNDSPNDRSHVWSGTGFGLSDSEWFATAAHVLQEVKVLQSSFERKGVPSRVVIRYPDAAISSLAHAKLHPQFRLSNRNTDEPSCDIAVFLSDPPRPVTRLPLAEQTTPEIGDEVFVAGFPQSVPQIRYPSHLEEPFVPTVRCGRVERLIDVGDLAKSSLRNLLQLDVPLVGGFSGSPVVNFSGKVVGIAVFATHRHIKVMADDAKTSRGDTTRILDAAHVSFAVSATLLKEMLDGINREGFSKGLEGTAPK